MASIVLGLGTSHSPQISAPVTRWAAFGDRDRANPALLGLDGELHPFAELGGTAPAVDPAELTDTAWAAKHARAEAALQALSDRLEAAAPDVVVIVGDDQEEMFLADGIPAFAVCWGEAVSNRPPSPEQRARIPLDVQSGLWAYHGDEPEDYPVATGLARHLIESSCTAGFDVTQVRDQAPDRTLGHAFTFVERRLMRGRPTPIVPVAVNAYYEPNQPSARRCLEFGRALGDAIASWPEDARVAVVASGGLSHFVVDEDLDRQVLAAIAARDDTALASIPQHRLRSGTSEIRNWIAGAGALRHLEFTVVEYVPAYRTEAGTGVGMAFAAWA